MWRQKKGNCSVQMLRHSDGRGATNWGRVVSAERGRAQGANNIQKYKIYKNTKYTKIQNVQNIQKYIKIQNIKKYTKIQNIQNYTKIQN
jgi:hypothetical protein